MELAIRMTAEVGPDEALVQSFVEGDDGAFEQLVRRHEELVLRIVRRWARDGDDARDLSQRTFVRAFESARKTFQRSFPSTGAERIPFQRWLVRIAVNLARNHARDASRWSRAPLDHADSQPHDGPDPTAALAAGERAARLRRAMLELPPRQREVLALRLDTELPFAEIAAALEISENAAKVSFHHAAKRLRDLIQASEAGEE